MRFPQQGHNPKTGFQPGRRMPTSRVPALDVPHHTKPRLSPSEPSAYPFLRNTRT